MRNAQFVGRICTEIKPREAGQHIVYSFLLACQGRKKDESHFFSIEAWNKVGEGIAKYFKKGQPIELSCTVEHERWEDKDGAKRERVKFTANSWAFLPINKGSEEHKDSPSESQSTSNDDDIPF